MQVCWADVVLWGKDTCTSLFLQGWKRMLIRHIPCRMQHNAGTEGFKKDFREWTFGCQQLHFSTPDIKSVVIYTLSCVNIFGSRGKIGSFTFSYQCVSDLGSLGTWFCSR